MTSMGGTLHQEGYLKGTVEPKIDIIDTNVDKLVSRTAPTVSSGTYSYLDVGGEQAVVSLTITKVTRVYFMIDLTNLTQNGTIKIQSKIDGTNYKTLMSNMFVAGTTNGLGLGPFFVNTDTKLTYQESLDEGAARDLPYRAIQIISEE